MSLFFPLSDVPLPALGTPMNLWHYGIFFTLSVLLIGSVASSSCSTESTFVFCSFSLVIVGVVYRGEILNVDQGGT